MKMMKYLLLPAAALLLQVLTGAPLEIGAPARELSSAVWKDMKIRHLSDRGDKYLVIYFWSPERVALKELPVLDEVVKTCPEAVFWTVAIGDKDKIANFAPVKDLKTPLNFDIKGESAGMYVRESDRMPLAVIIDPKGNFIWRGRLGGVPITLGRCLSGKYDLEEYKRMDVLASRVNEAMEKKNYNLAVKLINEQWLRSPEKTEFISLQLTLLTRKLKRPAQGWPLLKAAHNKLPDNAKVYELEYKYIIETGELSRLPDFFNRAKKGLAKQPMCLLGLAIGEMQRPSASVDLKNAAELATLGWKSGELKDEMLIGVYAVEYSKILHTCGRTDLALKVMERAVKSFAKDEKRRKAAENAVIFYRKVLEVAPGLSL